MDAVMQTIAVSVKVLDHAKELALPDYATDGAAGMDLLAAIPAAITIKPGHRELIPTGIAMALPVGFEAQVRPRSGLAIKHGITVLNAPGTIDCDYRGEVGMILINLGQDNFAVERGMRVAQMVIAPYARAQWHAVNDLSATDRGTGGFGSTGITAGSNSKED